MELEFKRDTTFRKQFFTPESFAHPAKMDSRLLLWIVEHYTETGETILDLMAGMGTTMLACTLGRNVMLVELEEKFCKMCHDNWEIVKTKPQLGSTLGDCQIIQGDARQLEGLLADKIITSPPYAEGAKGPSRALWGRLAQDPTSARYGRQKHPSIGEGYSENPQNIGNLPYGQIDKIVTSPPYEGSVADDKEGPGAGGNEAKYGRWAKGTAKKQSYTQHSEPTKIDNIITSPPYEEAQSGGGIAKKGYQGSKHSPTDLVGKRSYMPEVHGQTEGNIGNLKTDFYLEAMLQVYQQCHKVLKPQGLMILVTKNFIRNKQVIRLDTDTIKLCQQAGFSFIERHYRKLSAQSFWRIIYYQKHPEVEQINYEDVLVFQR